MNLPSRLLLSTTLAVTAAVFWAAPALAGDFKADYAVDYAVRPDTGLTHVKQQVTLTNQAPNLRASSYSLTLEKNGYQNLVATDSGGKIKYVVNTASDGTPTLVFTFNDHVVGIGNQLKWTIEYDSPTIAQKHGQVWDITIPRVKESQSYDIASYTARLAIPKSVGKEEYLSPSTQTTAHTATDYLYTFNKDQILPTGIVAAFGNAQVFSFNLKYHLQNPNLGQASTEIALPADLPGYQQIIYKNLQPQPVSMRTDTDGNALATYYLAPHASMDITFTGWARVDEKAAKLDSTQTATSLPQDLVQTYTQEQKYWEVSNPELVKATKAITSPDKPAVQNARAIYDYVTSTLQYNTARINKNLTRMGALAAFHDPKNAVCMEFTDLFVTMARIAGIPAREVDGYAYTTDSANQPIFYPGLGSDILHAWAQIYLPGDGWVMVDPTWGSTTGGVNYFGRIDLNRIAFAIKGVSSQTPYAAGSYKTNSKQDGDVQVKFSDQPEAGQGGIAAALDDDSVIAGIGSTLPLRLTNNGNVAVYNVALNLSPTSPLAFSRTPSTTYASLLPGQSVVDWLPMRTSGWLNQANTTLAMSIKGQDATGTTISQTLKPTVHVQPFFGILVGPTSLMIILVGLAVGGGWFGLHKLYERQGRAVPAHAATSPIDKLPD